MCYDYVLWVLKPAPVEARGSRTLVDPNFLDQLRVSVG